MTTITAQDLTLRGFRSATTRFDRALLRAASALDAYVVARQGRRRHADRSALAAQTSVTGVRRDAEAIAATGMLPR